ncbi:hypothetical protein AB0O07_02550 [Streptomyces sp. NPDC093085]|uniref:hypothetical protein n=1 Tax=Streptomyces sp. NPDC093085 TaxID=3155068 RepID=UPI00341DE276
MAVRQLPVETGTFARYLTGLTALLDPGAGWYGVFLHRDPEGLRACLDGTEIPPWDVVESLLQDYAAGRARGPVAEEAERARRLYTASAAATDRLPGGHRAVEDRLRLMDQERLRAARRAEELVRLLRTVPEGSADERRFTHELAWTRDDLARATSRCAELGARLAALPDPGEEAGEAGEAREAAPAPAPRPKKRRPRGARFAGLEIDEAEETEEAERTAGTEGTAGTAGTNGAAGGTGGTGGGVRTEVTAPAPASVLPVYAAPAAPRGARFGGAPTGPAAPSPVPSGPSPEDHRAAAETVAALRELRAAGRTGEAHVVLCEAARRQPRQLPPLADALDRAGLGADWAELLWEAAFLPPVQLAAAAGALAAAGRDGDCGQLLRQGVARPAEEIADAAGALRDAGLAHEARALLGAFVQARTAQDAARLAAGDPRRLVPYLLEAARTVSTSHERAVVHALRVAGIAPE